MFVPRMNLSLKKNNKQTKTKKQKKKKNKKKKPTKNGRYILKTCDHKDDSTLVYMLKKT
jgi:hypothetical protein